MRRIRDPTAGRVPRRRVTAKAVVAALFLAGVPSVALAEGLTCVGESCDGSLVAIATTGTANSSGGVAVSGTGYANGSVASIGGTGNASRDSLVTTNVEASATAIGAADNAAYTYQATGVDNYIGTYALAAMTVREQLGIATGVDDLSDAVDDTVRTMIDELLLNNAQAMTQSYIDAVNAPINEATDTVLYAIGGATACPPTYVCMQSQYDKYKSMNEQEQRVCRNEPYDCKRAKDTAPDAYEHTERRYGRNGNGDTSDAFRHCIWSAFMTKRANSGFAKRFGDAHENGDKNQPSNDYWMDLHNNSWGREAGRNYEGYSDNQVAWQCQYYQRNSTLTWYR